MSKYQYFKIRLASPEEILSWSHGEVTKHETINYRTLKPEPDGLFCEKIFGPQKDYQCACGKSKRNTDKGKICEKCGVEITESKVRRERMGHIKLASPVVHTWYLRNSPSPLATLLDIKTKDLEEIVYLASYIIIDPGKTGLPRKKILSEMEYSNLLDKFGTSFTALTGAEAVKKLLQEIDLEKEQKALRKKLSSSSKQRRDHVIKRLEIVESFLQSDNKPEWMILEVLPVIPPDLRPMVQLDGGRFATTDLNDLYRRILNRNNRLKRQYEQNAPALITKNEKRMLQEAVDALIDNSKRGKKAAVEKKHNLKSLSDLLRGKQGRFRQNLLGKRVDYSGRSVIVVGPSLKMYQCGIPKEMALTLFKPFVIRLLIEGGKSISQAKKACEAQDDSVWGILESVVQEHPVLLNRAPTLHRLGIQAFEPVLIEGKAIRLHPLVCTAFNADFDGDQMAVHVPLSLEAQAEARLLMLAANNILNPKDGKPVVTPSQDMVLGNYYLTMERAYDVNNEKLTKELEETKAGIEKDMAEATTEERKEELRRQLVAADEAYVHACETNYKQRNEGHFYTCFDEAYIAYKNNEISLHTRIFVDPKSLPAYRFEGVDLEGKYLFTTLGKMIFNQIMPEGFPYLNEPTGDNLTKSCPETYLLAKSSGKAGYDAMIAHEQVKPFVKKFLAQIIGEVFKKFKITETSRMLDRLKDLGFKYSTTSGITISVADVLDYRGKHERIEQADKRIDDITTMFDMGLLTDGERKKLVETEWKQARDQIQDGLWSELAKQQDNAIFMMADSGSRGSASNFAQLAGMRGLMANTAGQTIEVPVKANFREGLTVGEFFISTHGSRKGSTDTALKTAESGYLTRRLVDVSQDVIVSMIDCGTDNYFLIDDIKNDEGKIPDGGDMCDRILGRFCPKNGYYKNGRTGEVLVAANSIINEPEVSKIKKALANEELYYGNKLVIRADAKLPEGYSEATVVRGLPIRSNLTCKAASGVCMKCYGRNLATNKIVEVGEAVGTVAAQSIGEPGTQLTMRTFHTGGVASTADITQGLPRVQELFEARKPKGKATIAEDDGVVTEIEKKKTGLVITVQSDDKEIKEYTVEMTSEPLVRKGDRVNRGDKLIKGSIAPRELLRAKDTVAVQNYILDEVKQVYLAQGVEIADKHIEIIVRQMLRRLIVTNEGCTDLLPGREVSAQEFARKVQYAKQMGGSLPVAKQLLLGITKAALASDSFLSACSFQETTRILTSAAIKSKKDYLVGLKENVIIGGLIPAGTGLLEEESFSCEHKPLDEDEIEEGQPSESIYEAVGRAVAEETDEDEIDEIEDSEDLDVENDEIDA